MKKFSIALALALGVAAAPGYAVTVVVGGKNIPPAGGFATGSATLDFNTDTVGSPGPDSFSGGLVVNGNAAGYVEPFGDTTNYYSVGPSTSSPAILPKKPGDPASGLAQLSLYWGSIDSDNTISFLGLGPSGVFTGASFLDGSPEGSVSRLVTFYLTPTEGAEIQGVEFSSTSNPFEFDNLGLSTVFSASVPEPSVWAMMIVGLGLVGAALRRGVPTVGRAFSIA